MQSDGHTMYETTIHGDGTVTVWDVYQQQWITLPCGEVPDRVLASLSQHERDAIMRRAVQRQQYVECGDFNADLTPCTRPAVPVSVAPPHSPNRSGHRAYCDLHGGIARATEAARRDWAYLAPASLGDGPESIYDIQSAGASTPTSRAYYCASMPDPNADGHWLAFVGIGGHAYALRGYWLSRDAAIDAAVSVVLRHRDEAIASIREARGGTLEWGLPVGQDAPVRVSSRPGWDGSDPIEVLDIDSARERASRAVPAELSNVAVRELCAEIRRADAAGVLAHLTTQQVRLAVKAGARTAEDVLRSVPPA